jgi:CRISPR-associated protein Csm1
LGGRLRQTDYIIISDSELSYFKKESINPIGLGYFCYFIEGSEMAANQDNLSRSADRVRVIHFNKKDFLEPVQKGMDNTYGFTFYGGNNFPADRSGNPKTFEELAGVEFKDEEKEERETAPSLVRLGVLRMDVDNLGTIFQKGFAPELRTFSRYCTLSRSLDYFFKGYLNHISESDPDFRAFTQIIYSGGDDLFIVGRWDVLPRMAARIREEFARWTCHNPDLSLSGGMAVVPPKFPLLKAALFAEDFEKAAKGTVRAGKTKNAFSFFADTYYPGKRSKHKETVHGDEEYFAFSWEGEWKYLNALKEKIKELTGREGGLPEGFAADVYNLSRQAEFERDGGGFRLRNYEVIWLAAYKFKRMIRGRNVEVNRFLSDWTRYLMAHRIEDAPETHASPYHPLQWLALAARWADLEKRSLTHK